MATTFICHHVPSFLSRPLPFARFQSSPPGLKVHHVPSRTFVMGLRLPSWLRLPSRTIDVSSLPPTVPAVRVHKIVKRYKRREKRGKKKHLSEITAVNKLSFDAWRGEVFGLLGPNSSGKTTTLRCISTLAQPDEGYILVNGVDVHKDPVMVRMMIGYVAQGAGLDRVLTGREHLELFADLNHLSQATKRRNIEVLVDALGLAEYLDRQTLTYSGGIKRRLDMAIGLLNQPSVLILDEPTVGLDIESRVVIWELLQTVKDNGACILLTSHYLEEVDVLADRVAILDHGVVLSEGTPSQLKKRLGGDRISIRLDEFTSAADAERASELLRSKGLASQAIINRVQNNTIELVVPSDDGAIGSHIIRALKSAGYDSLFSFSQSRPSLGDVYLAATGNDFADADLIAAQKRDVKASRKETMI